MLSATDVANFLACHHLLTLDLAQSSGQIKRPFFHDPGIDLLRELGAKHEQAYFRYLVDFQGLQITEIPANVSWSEAVSRTVDALRRGVSAVYQATFQSGPWHGRSDFLVRVEKPSVLGPWSPRSVLFYYYFDAGRRAEGHGISVQPEPLERRHIACAVRGGDSRKPGVIPSAMQDSATDRARKRVLSVFGNGSPDLNMVCQAFQIVREAVNSPDEAVFYPSRFASNRERRAIHGHLARK
jgi:hypothetical protein